MAPPAHGGHRGAALCDLVTPYPASGPVSVLGTAPHDAAVTGMPTGNFAGGTCLRRGGGENNGDSGIAVARTIRWGDEVRRMCRLEHTSFTPRVESAPFSTPRKYRYIPFKPSVSKWQPAPPYDEEDEALRSLQDQVRHHMMGQELNLSGWHVEFQKSSPSSAGGGRKMFYHHGVKNAQGNCTKFKGYRSVIDHLQNNPAHMRGISHEEQEEEMEGAEEEKEEEKEEEEEEEEEDEEEAEEKENAAPSPEVAKEHALAELREHVLAKAGTKLNTAG